MTTPPPTQPVVRWADGLHWALLSPTFLGIIPIFAKLAYRAQAPVFTVVAMRTLFAAGLLWLLVLIISPKTIFIPRRMLLGCLLAGGINGIGSLFYYSSINLIDASLGQLINISYLLFLAILLSLTGQKFSQLTLYRILIAIVGIYLLTAGHFSQPDADHLRAGVSLMFFGAAAYACQLFLSQHLLKKISAESMTLYALTAMAIVVTCTWFFVPDIPPLPAAALSPILFMGAFTLLSRITLFFGVKHLGSMQTALLGVAELFVTLLIAGFWLGERLSLMQWIGGALLVSSIFLIYWETRKNAARDPNDL